MIGALGSSALIVALGVAVVGAGLAVLGVRRGRAEYVRGPYAAIYTNFAAGRESGDGVRARDARGQRLLRGASRQPVNAMRSVKRH